MLSSPKAQCERDRYLDEARLYKSSCCTKPTVTMARECLFYEVRTCSVNDLRPMTLLNHGTLAGIMVPMLNADSTSEVETAGQHPIGREQEAEATTPSKLDDASSGELSSLYAVSLRSIWRSIIATPISFVHQPVGPQYFQGPLHTRMLHRSLIRLFPAADVFVLTSALEHSLSDVMQTSQLVTDIISMVKSQYLDISIAGFSCHSSFVVFIG